MGDWRSKDDASAQRLAAWIFMAAAMYGLVLLLPLFGTEAMLARRGQPLFDRPEYFYGFLGTATSMQLVYWTIGRNPGRYRSLMPVMVVAKLAFFVPTTLLWFAGRVGATVTIASAVDGLIAIAFAYAWLGLRRMASPAKARP